jgi:hypothetical protein
MSEWPTLPRYTALPGDPPELRRWLAAQTADASESDSEYPPPPEEPTR